MDTETAHYTIRDVAAALTIIYAVRDEIQTDWRLSNMSSQSALDTIRLMMSTRDHICRFSVTA